MTTVPPQQPGSGRPGITWRKSTRSSSNASASCVEVGLLRARVKPHSTTEPQGFQHQLGTDPGSPASTQTDPRSS
ncbi:DUF397 domain-containing protein [Stackebrandtia sp.]|uniref:DUF397 domain-containing protein n=1 Tax=Stackebrandtia sp. TaxID=2023065 RepID=UPI0039C9D912